MVHSSLFITNIDVKDPPSIGGINQGELPIMSIENLTLSAAADLAHSSLSHTSTSVENPLQINPFYAKQTQSCPP